MVRPRVIVFSHIESASNLAEVILRHADLAAIVRPAARIPSPVFLEFCRERHIPVLVQKSSHPHACRDLARQLAAVRADLIVAYSYSLIIPAVLRQATSRGAVNIHLALLPEYRGIHALNWTLINGESQTGVTIHEIDDGVDTGAIIAQERIPISVSDTASTLSERLIALAYALFERTLPSIIDGSASRTPQDHSRGHHYPPRRPEDGRIDWSRPAHEIYNLIRALVAPWPGAYYLDVAQQKIVIPNLLSLEDVIVLQERNRE